MFTQYLKKTVIAALIIACLVYGAAVSATSLYVYNHGYVMGELNNIDLVGPSRLVVTGQVSIGNNSFGSRNDFRSELNGDYILSNPWSFCGDKDIYQSLVNYIGEFVLIEYKTPKASSLLQCQSANEIIGIYPVSRNTPSSHIRESSRVSVAGKPFGVSVGRIVNAQQSDRHGKNWSIVVQVGNGGNDFRYLNIVDEALYEFALECLSTATRVKLYHVEQIHGATRPDRVESYVWKIETRAAL